MGKRLTLKQIKSILRTCVGRIERCSPNTHHGIFLVYDSRKRQTVITDLRNIIDLLNDVQDCTVSRSKFFFRKPIPETEEIKKIKAGSKEVVQSAEQVLHYLVACKNPQTDKQELPNSRLLGQIYFTIHKLYDLSREEFEKSFAGQLETAHG